MKNIKYLLFTILILFMNVFCVYASCTEEEIKNLKELASEIKISYKHLGRVEYEDGRTVYSEFEVKVKNLTDDLYVSLFNGSLKMIPSDGMATEVFSSGTWYFEVYSNKCDEKIDEIKVFLPRFNMYSLDPLCEGIDGNDFALCGKYYEYDVSYDNFKKRVEHYRATHTIDDISDENKINDISIQIIFDKVVNFILNYKFYFISGLLFFLVTIIIISIVKKRKKRGVLE